MNESARSYEGKKHRRFHYKEDRDSLQRGISVMIDLLNWTVWLLIGIAIIIFAGLLGMSFYLLTRGVVD